MSYFMLECVPPLQWDDNAMIKTPQKRLVPRGESWSTGKRFSVPPQQPIEFEMMETHNDQMLELRRSDPMLMTKRLHDALQKAGVNNMDSYMTIIKHPKTGFITEDYLAVNVVGVVDDADDGGDISEGVNFDSEKAGDLLMFRLVNTIGVVIHESVRDSLLKQGFDMLDFVPLDEYIG